MDLSESTRITEALSVAEVLRRAKQKLVNPKNWWRGGPGGVGYECVGLAIMSSGDRLQAQVACNVLARVIRTTPGDSQAIYRWNDAPGRKHAEVMAALDRAIELAG
jgi:hypothetical protein